MVRKAMEYTARHNYFLVGNMVVRRRRGWAMGSSMSEPAALTDLGGAVYETYSSLQKWKRTGLQVENLTPLQTLQAVLHVDDALAFSRVWCAMCIEKGIGKIFPPDVGTTLEGTGPQVHFLHADVAIDGISVEVTPHTDNQELAEGKAVYQK